MGGTRTYAGRGAQKGKGVGTATKAVAKDATLHLDLLRAFPAEDGSIFIHRNGARSDSQLLEPSFLVQVMSCENQELLNRPGKGLSMLAGLIVHGALALQRLDQEMVLADRPSLLQRLQELEDACSKIDPTRKKQASVEEAKAALQELLTFLTGASTASVQRLAALGGHLYVCAMQVLEAETSVITLNVFPHDINTHCNSNFQYVYGYYLHKSSICNYRSKHGEISLQIQNRGLEVHSWGRKGMLPGAQTTLASRELWAAEVAKQIATRPQAFRAFVEKPASDLALLEALTASITATATSAAQGEDLFSPPAAKAAPTAVPAASSGGGWETKRHTNLEKIHKNELSDHVISSQLPHLQQT